ncbi:hypothetical protein CEY16_11010 [Halalkalibacillus sediminis]|uniref:Uncharacterized protein n=1 Tax=Halalkalibacillus sediminis TaxID=2018042 RepID=A0A2I0QSG8_9BACI|nr:methyltransferase domain-containing protein [Halalkalibacillus sediminis]PKR77259.1 hypothetical protein CEY16_11010 [Halalkalibacillus sediminis]
MRKESKKSFAARTISGVISIFKCPVCGSEMKIEDLSKLVCEENHQFDLAKQGYLHMVQQHKKTKYSKELFESRQDICQSGFYDGLIDGLHEVIYKLQNSKQPSVILDAGTGEGSHLVRLSDQLNEEVKPIGMDIAKEGIQVAARSYTQATWIVADLANIPLQPHSVDFLLNILSPANYDEFKRVMNEESNLIKVVPGEKYLEELRAQVGHDAYSNEKTVDHLSEHFTLIERKTVHYKAEINPQMFENLIKMTPLTWNTDPADLKYCERITVHLEILVCKK